MEIIGVCTTEYLKSEILFYSSNLRMKEEMALVLNITEMKEIRDYPYISLNTLDKMRTIFESKLVRLYKEEKENLHNPKGSRESKKFKLGHREEYLSFFDKFVFVYFANATHKKILLLDRVVTFLKKAFDKKMIGFIYKYPEGAKARKLILSIQKFTSNEGRLLNIPKEKEFEFQENLTFYLNNDLIVISDTNYYCTHKFLVFS